MPNLNGRLERLEARIQPESAEGLFERFWRERCEMRTSERWGELAAALLGTMDERHVRRLVSVAEGHDDPPAERLAHLCRELVDRAYRWGEARLELPSEVAEAILRHEPEGGYGGAYGELGKPSLSDCPRCRLPRPYAAARLPDSIGVICWQITDLLDACPECDWRPPRRNHCNLEA